MSAGPCQRHSLSSEGNDREADVWPWQADAGLAGLGDGAAAAVSWRKLRRRASRLSPFAFERLHQLRVSGLAIPEFQLAQPSVLVLKLRYFWATIA